MTGGAPKGLVPATTPFARAAFLRLRLYEHYDHDEDVRAMLMQLYRASWGMFGPSLRRLVDCLPDLDEAKRQLAEREGDGSARVYLCALTTLAATVGLDRIPMLGTPPAVIAGYLPSGTAQAHRFLWHLDKALLWEAAPIKADGRPVERPTFVGLASQGLPVPAVDTSIPGTDAQWDPRSELLADARRRLRRETTLSPETIEAELGRIVAEGDYELPDTSTERSGIWGLDRDAEWVWWRIRRRWTYPQIAAEWECRHPRHLRLQSRADDSTARQWEAEHRDEPWTVVVPTDAASLVRKAVTTFARRARVDVKTGPGRPAGRAE